MKYVFEIEENEAAAIVNALCTPPAGELMKMGILSLPQKLHDQFTSQQQIQKSAIIAAMNKIEAERNAASDPETTATITL